MVLYKYCPKCYSLNVGMDQATGGHKCRQCGYSGSMSQDSIEKINTMKKSKDGQRYAAASQSARPLRTGSAGNDCEIMRKKVDDPFNDDIESIEVSDSGEYDDEEPKESDLESRQSNIMKRSSQQPLPVMHGLSHKSGKTVKERLKEKGGKDWDLV